MGEVEKKIAKRLVTIANEDFKGNQSEMSRSMDMSPQGMNPYFNGERSPGFKILKRLVELGYNITWIVAGVPPMRISQIQESGVISFTSEDVDKYGEKGIDEIASNAPKELKLSQLTPEVYNSPVKMMSYIVQDFEKAWQKEGIYLSEEEQVEVLEKMMDIIIQQATNAKSRLKES